MKRYRPHRFSLRTKYEQAMEEAREYFLESVPHVAVISVSGSVARGDPGPKYLGQLEKS